MSQQATNEPEGSGSAPQEPPAIDRNPQVNKHFSDQFDDVAEPSFRRALNRQQATMRILAQKTQEKTTQHCFPKGFTLHLIPLCTSVAALALTGAGSWDCSYFSGAHIEFTGDQYGLWTLRDSTGKCQLWDVLFFAYDLGAPLISARVFSMTAMLMGLALSATMAQASQFHLASWGIGLALLLLFLVSLSTTSIFNVWVVFWLFSYAILVLLIRFLFIHPVPRRISQRGAKIIAGCFVFCSCCCILTLVVLTSDYCTCAGLTTERLDGRDPGEPCSGSCKLGAAGYFMILASIVYLVAAVCCTKLGIQPDELKHNSRRPDEWYAHYPQQSIVTRVRGAVDSIVGSSSHHESESSSQHGSKHGTSADDKDNSSTTETEDDDGSSEANLSRGSAARSKAAASVNSSALESIGEHEEVRANTVSKFRGDEEVEEDGPQPLEQQNDDGIMKDDGLEENEAEDHRGCCQKCCCDFRVKPRSRLEKWVFWSFRTSLGIGVFIYALFIYMMIGSRFENTIAAKKPDTTPFFTMDAVCAFNPDDPTQPFETFVNRDAAKARNWTVAHCGECGYCSNPHDIITYVETRKTIAKSSKSCGPNVYLGDYEDVADCLEEKIGFTRPCTNCWADNMISTGEKCLSTCLRTLFSGFMTDNNVPGAGDEGWMNQCLFCDEKRSGPAFVTCSGVARRRLGIVSEIERNPEEQCKRVDMDWVNIEDWEAIGFQKVDI